MTHSKAVSPGQVYYHVVYVSNAKTPSELLDIGVFSKRRIAEGVVRELKGKDGFNKGEGKFYISRGSVDVVGWVDGFISVEEYLRSLQ